MQLLGRERERAALDRLVESARDGYGGALVVHGEPGVGKTALLDDAVEKATTRASRPHAPGSRARWSSRSPRSSSSARRSWRFAERLPRPQRDALDIAFGLSPGPAPNPFLVALAVLGLLSEAARERGLLCVIDDAQWLDRASAQALGFAARRLAVERIAIVFAAREMGEALRGLPEVHVEPLGHRDARALLESVLPAPLDDQVLERLIVETRGNPLALVELPHDLTSSQLAGGFGVPAAAPVHAGIEESFERRVAALPRDARLLVLIAASDPTGDAALVWRAAERLGIPESAALRGGVERPDRVPATTWPSGIRSFAPRSIGPPAPRSEPRSIGLSPTRPIPRPTRIGAPGTERRRRSCPTKTSPRTWNVPRRGPRHAAGSLRPRRSSNVRRR